MKIAGTAVAVCIALSGCAASPGGVLGSGALVASGLGASAPDAAPGGQDTVQFGILLNDARGAVSVQPVTFSQTLTDVAQAHATDMAQNGYFSHTGLNGSTIADRIDAAGYEYDWAAENLLRGTTDEAVALQAWMNSPPHRDAMLSPRAEEFGLGLDDDLFVLVLASPAN